MPREPRSGCLQATNKKQLALSSANPVCVPCVENIWLYPSGPGWPASEERRLNMEVKLVTPLPAPPTSAPRMGTEGK